MSGLSQQEAGELLSEAVELLLLINPSAARAFHLCERLDLTQEEAASRLGTTAKTIRNWLNGYTRAVDHVYVWGAFDWLENLLDLLVEGARHEREMEVSRALYFAWCCGFPKSLLDMLWASMDAAVLPVVLTALSTARADPGTYAQAMENLLSLYEIDQLSCLIDRLREMPELSTAVESHG